MKRILCCAVYALCGIPLFAQSHVEVLAKPDNTVDFCLAGVDAPGTRTVLLNLTGLTNCDHPVGEYPFVVSNDGVFLTLRPHDSRIGIGYDYTYRVLDAWLNAPADRAFVYRLPCSAARPAAVAVREKQGVAGPSKDFSACCFACEKGDTVYAVRRGVVTQVRYGESEPGAGAGGDSALRNSSLYVEHADGSVARYGMPEGANLLVKAGEVVFPDTPLASAGDGSTSFSVSLFRVVLNSGKNAGLYFVLFEYFRPLFATDRGNTRLLPGESYRPVVTRELVGREMTAKEAKRYERGKRR